MTASKWDTGTAVKPLLRAGGATAGSTAASRMHTRDGSGNSTLNPTRPFRGPSAGKYKRRGSQVNTSPQGASYHQSSLGCCILQKECMLMGPCMILTEHCTDPDRPKIYELAGLLMSQMRMLASELPLITKPGTAHTHRMFWSVKRKK